VRAGTLSTVKAITAAAAGAAAVWALLVAASPRGFFAAAAPFCALWLLLSARAAPPGLSARLRPRPGDLGLALSTALLLYALSRAFLWAGCGGLTDVLCGPLAAMFHRFDTRGLLPALVLGLLVAPAEELFWRGFVQERLALRFGRAPAVALATALAVALALATGEPFLALATAPTYAAWGALAAWRRSLVPSLVSHSAWSVLVAAVAPPL
jgi:membrane protease YdiL (CAAX protease family)